MPDNRNCYRYNKKVSDSGGLRTYQGFASEPPLAHLSPQTPWILNPYIKLSGAAWDRHCIPCWLL